MTERTISPNKIAPNSSEAEEAVLGSVLINDEAMPAIIGYLQPVDFFIVRNMWIFEAMIGLYERGDAIDNLTVVAELQSRRKLEQIGGSAYITRLINNTPTHIHAETYARLVERAAIRRRGIQAAADIAQMFLDENADLTSLILKAHDTLTQGTKMKQGSKFRLINEFASENYDKVEARYNEHGVPLGISTGLYELDRILVAEGWQDSELIVLAARPGMGKSALAFGCAVAAARTGKHVAVITKEMTGNELHFRALSSASGINASKIKNGRLFGNEFDRFAGATVDTSQLPIAIDDSAATNIQELKEDIKRLHREWHIDLIIVDYVQLLCSEEKKPANRNLEISVISRTLKELAMKLRIPVLALSQLNRDLEARKEKRPMLSDLRDSGALEQDADTVIFIYRDEMYHENSADTGKAELIVAKQRHGKIDTAKVGWIADLTKFVDIAGTINLEDFAL